MFGPLKRLTRMALAAGVGAASLTVACDDPVDPVFAESPLTNCHEQSGIEVCIEKSEYEPGEMVAFTVSNGLDREVYYNACTGGIEGRPTPDDEWGKSHNYLVFCAILDGVPYLEQLRSSMRPMHVGELAEDTFMVHPEAFAGEWRVWVDVVNWDAEKIGRFTSPVFTVGG